MSIMILTLTCNPVPSYEQPSGYKPAPLDLSQVFLSPTHKEVVDLLAENDHNVWARECIKQGWTHGDQQVYIVFVRHQHALATHIH